MCLARRLRLDWDAFYALREACIEMETWITDFEPLRVGFILWQVSNIFNSR